MTAIILAGGFGTRLKHVLPNLPKPMADIKGRPFLSLLFDELKNNNIHRVILSVGYKWNVIQEYFKDEYKGIQIQYIIEDTPLGTGGAIKDAIANVQANEVFVLNGDTFIDVDYAKLKEEHNRNNADITLCVKRMKNFDRYGTVGIAQHRIVSFEEKKYCEDGCISTGVYCMNRSFFDGMILPQSFSFEIDILEKYVDKKKIHAFVSDGYFIDIGIPEDLEKARREL